MTIVAPPRRSQQAPTVSTDTLYATPMRIYPKDVHGPARRAKWAILAGCLFVYYVTPWIRWDRGNGAPDQAVLIDVWNERFYIFDLVLWPQDIYLLTGLLILAALSLFLVTSLFGRLWCGYTCPQTVWTDLFMLVERRIQGDRNARMKRDAGAPSWDRRWRKTLTHATWLVIAFWTGGAWIMYYVDAPTAVREFWSGAASVQVYFFVCLFTATTYLLAGWAREQVCTYMCPWPRFQSAMFDEQTLTVTYQAWRGEPRGRGRRDTGTKLGDCVDCDACVHVCPTGIDIRDGVQLECINCGLCVDACNHVMERQGTPRDLVTWDTLARQAAKRAGRTAPHRFVRARTIIYLIFVTLIAGAVLTGLLIRSTTNLSVIHDRAPLFVRLKDGGVRNGYTVKIANKTQQDVRYELSIGGLPQAGLMLSETSPALQTVLRVGVPADSVAGLRVLVQQKPPVTAANRLPIDFLLRDMGTGRTTRYGTLFMGAGTP